MKKLFTTLAVTFAMALQAQPAEGQTQTREKMTPEQRAELQAKRMSLHLELNKTQQAQVQKLMVAQFKKTDQMRATHQQARAEGQTRKALSAEERFEMQNAHLDEQLAFQNEMKKILTPEQFDKWKEMKAHRQERGKKQMAQRHTRHKPKRGGN